MIRLLVVFCAFAISLDVAAEELALVRVGLGRDASTGPMYIAALAGYFAAEGLDARLEFFDSDARVPAAVASGALDMGVTTLTASYFAFSATHDLKMLASYEGDQAGYPGNTLVIAKKAYDAGLRTWQDMPGKRVGMTTAGAGLHYALAQIATKYAFDLRNVRIAWLQTPAKAMTALARGQVDAALVPAVAAMQLGSSTKTVTLRRVGDETPWQESVVFTSGQTIQDRRALVEKFVRAYQRGAAEYDQTFLQRGDGSEVIKGAHYDEYLALMARHSGMPAELRAYLIPWSDRLGRLDVADIQRQLQFWQAQRMVDGSISAAALLDLSFISGHIGDLH
ncbi:MAG TPA: ABC transporter substrate-binding protein [Casimicrobiaceae bacterium]|nr:ABC transporter substrate-binding protein [Casimicrobiaceae bacterium]